MIPYARTFAFASVACLLAAPALAQGEPDPLWEAIQSTPEAQAAAKSDPGVWNAGLDAAAIEACLSGQGEGEDGAACRSVITERCEGEGETYAMLACSQRETEAWGRLEEVARTALLEGASPAQIDALNAGHSAWLSFREADCASEALDFEGGSMGRVIGAGCFADHTVKRALSLRLRLAAREG